MGLCGLWACNKGEATHEPPSANSEDTAAAVSLGDASGDTRVDTADAASDIDTPTDTGDAAGDPDAPPGTDTAIGDSGTGPDDGAWSSALFPDDWEVGFAVEVGDGGPLAQLQDYSFAGYKAGEEAVPDALSLDMGLRTSVVDHGADGTGSA